jgi:hypothetical protein
MNDYPASDKQVKYIHDCFDGKDLFADPAFFDKVNAMDNEEFFNYVAGLKQQVGDPEDKSKPRISARRAGEILDKLTKLPWKKREAVHLEKSGPGPDAKLKLVEGYAVGMYVVETDDGIDPERIFRVYLGQQSGRNLVKRLAESDRPHPEDASIKLHDWEYVGAASGRKARTAMNGARKMTLAEAEEYGRMSGSCCACGRRLDVPESVERGIGPVCAKKDWWA